MTNSIVETFKADFARDVVTALNSIADVMQDYVNRAVVHYVDTPNADPVLLNAIADSLECKPAVRTQFLAYVTANTNAVYAGKGFRKDKAAKGEKASADYAAMQRIRCMDWDAKAGGKKQAAAKPVKLSELVTYVSKKADKMAEQQGILSAEAIALILRAVADEAGLEMVALVKDSKPADPREDTAPVVIDGALVTTH